MVKEEQLKKPPVSSKKPLKADLTVRDHRSEAEVEELRAFWSRAQHHPNSDLDHFLSACRLIPEVISPWVLSLWQAGACQAVLSGRLERARFQPRLGYLKLPAISGRSLTFIHQGAVGEVGEEEADILVKRAKNLLLQGIADVVVFNLVREGSPLLKSIATEPGSSLGAVSPSWSEHWELKLQDEPGFLVKAMRSKHRSWIRRKEREFETAFSGRVHWRWHTHIEQMPALCEQMETIACKTYQRGLGAGFKNDASHRERLGVFAQRGALRVMILEIDQQPRAFWVGVNYRGDFHSWATGFVPELAEYEVGTQMFLRLVDELIKEGVQRFDFGLGDAYYKKRFGDQSWRETTARMFANSVRGRLLRAYQGSCEATDRRIRTIIDKFGVNDKLKQFWRRQLTHKSEITEIEPRSEKD